MFKKFKTQCSEKFTVGVFGANGNVGRATIAGLAYYFSSKVNIKAIVRNPLNCQDLITFRSVEILEGEVGNSECRDILQGITSLFIIPPAVEDRIERTKVTLQLAKECKISHIVTISVTLSKNTQFGKEFSDLEMYIKQLGMPYTILQLPLFLDNFWIVKHTLPKIRLPIQKGKHFTPVVIADVGIAAAFVLIKYNQHLNKTYILTSERITMDSLVKHFTEILSQKIDYEISKDEEYEQFLIESGIEKWQIKGTVEFARLINECSSSMDIPNNTDFKKITGQNPTNAKEWISNAKEYFSV